MSFELSKDFLNTNMLKMLISIEFCEERMSDLERSIEGIAVSKLSAKEKFKQKESLKRLFAAKAANRDEKRKIFNQYSQELADLLRMEVLVGLVPDV